MDKKDLKPFKAIITLDKDFADYYDEAIEQLGDEGFLDARNPHKGRAEALWEDWDLTHKDDGTWSFTATVYGVSEADAKIATNVAYPNIDSASVRHLVRTEVEAVSEEPQSNAVIFVKHAFRYVFDKETAQDLLVFDGDDHDLKDWFYRSELLSGYRFRESSEQCHEQGDYNLVIDADKRRVEIVVIPKEIDVMGFTPLEQAHNFLGGVIDYENELALRSSLISVEAVTLDRPALPRNFGVYDEEPANDDEFVRVVIDGEPADYSYKFEVEQQFVLEHEDALGIPENSVRWWRNHGVSDAHVADWQQRESELVKTVKESKTFASLLK